MDALHVSEWNDFTGCVDGTDAAVAQFLRHEGLGAFNGGEELALTAIRAVLSWWDDVDPTVRSAISFSGPALGTAAKLRVGTIVADAGRVTSPGLTTAGPRTHHRGRSSALGCRRPPTRAEGGAQAQRDD
jgi:hypothetical protein